MIHWDDAATPRTWTWTSGEERQRRNEGVMELWAMGYTRREIAERYDITPQRVSQIVCSFGAGWR